MQQQQLSPLSVYATSPILYNGGFYRCVECAYQAQKIYYINEDLNDTEIQQKKRYYLETLEFDQEHGLDISKTKFIGSKEGFDAMGITLNIHKWNYRKLYIMWDILLTRYKFDDEFRSNVDNLNSNDNIIACMEKNSYWRYTVVNNRIVNNNLGNLMMKLR